MAIKSSFTESPLAAALWDFFNERDNIIRMETATLLKRPALEALEHELLARFKEQELKDPHCKQMMGKMVRQVMKQRGACLDQTGVRITSGLLFTSAARYTFL